MLEANPRGAIIYATGMEEKTISRQFAPNESGTLLEYVLDSVWTVADELFVVFKSEPTLSTIEALSPFGVKVLTPRTGQNPMATICDAFRLAKTEHCLLTTERLPLLKPNVALSLFENAIGYDLSIPKWKNGKTEPHLAVYRRKAFVRMADSLKRKFAANVDFEIASLAERLFAVNYVSIETDLSEIDPDLDSLLEVKDAKSLQAARSMASVRGKKKLS
ncbi:MAG: molybdenum cofactor guanylyltransferase [Nitrososphaerales archaeon]